MGGFVQVRPPQPKNGGFKQVKPKPTRSRPQWEQIGNYLNQQVSAQPAQPANGGFVQETPQFEQVRDRDNPEARRYAKQKLMGLVRQGIIPRYLPEWDKDPTAAWREISKTVFQPQAAAADTQRNSPAAGALPQGDWGGFGALPPGQSVPDFAPPQQAPLENMMPSADMSGADAELKRLMGLALLAKGKTGGRTFGQD